MLGADPAEAAALGLLRQRSLAQACSLRGRSLVPALVEVAASGLFQLRSLAQHKRLFLTMTIKPLSQLNIYCHSIIKDLDSGAVERFLFVQRSTMR